MEIKLKSVFKDFQKLSGVLYEPKTHSPKETHRGRHWGLQNMSLTRLLPVIHLKSRQDNVLKDNLNHYRILLETNSLTS